MENELQSNKIKSIICRTCQTDMNNSSVKL